MFELPPTLPAPLRPVFGFLSFWLTVFVSAVDTMAATFVARPTIYSLTVVGATGLFYLFYWTFWGKEALVADHWRPAVGALYAYAAMAFLVFVGLLAWTPFALHDMERSQAASLNQKLETTRSRLAAVVQQLPGPIFTAEQIEHFRSTLRNLGPHDVNLIYLDTPTSGASKIAGPIIENMRAAGWYVQVYPAVKGYENFRHVSMKVQDITQVSPVQQAVLDLFRDINIPHGLLVGQKVPPNEIHLIVGGL
jgi:hypothetical protein